MPHRPLIVIVDDDDAIRESLRALLEVSGLRVKDYPSARSFLADRATHGDCLVTDIRMPDMDGLELQEEILRLKLNIPVIVITGHADVPLAVRAMKAGAVDFIEKPFDRDIIVRSIERALEMSRQHRDRNADAKAAQELLALLTPRERDVLEKLVAGRPNKVAAYELGISPRTIEIHRARIMDKMRARSLSDVVRISLTASWSAAAPHSA